MQYSNGIVDFIHENCIGCGYCVKGCPFDIPRISKKDHRAYKCTLCSDRVAVGQGPACAKACPTQAIVFGTKEDMKKHAEGRIADLKSRGFENAGLYDPEGVGGTHVMYVLHHADKPHIYSNLPDHPVISPVVVAWKGVTKTAGLAAMGFAAAVAVLHGLFARANRVKAEDEESAKRLPRREDAHERDDADRTAAMRSFPAIRRWCSRYRLGTRINHWIGAHRHGAARAFRALRCFIPRCSSCRRSSAADRTRGRSIPGSASFSS